MFTLGPAVQKPNVRIEIKVGKGAFGLLLRPVSDDERLFERGLTDRFWHDDNPEMIGRIHVARSKSLLKLIVGWDGVVDPEGKAVPFTPDALSSLLSVAGSAVAEVLVDHFRGDGGAGQREKGESETSETLPQESSAADGSTGTTSLSSSVGMPDDSGQGSLPQG